MAIVWIILAQCACFRLASGQISNVALFKPVNVSSIYGGKDPALAVDGDTIARWPDVMFTALNQTFALWSVDLKTQVQDASVKIYFRIDYKNRRNGVQLYTSEAPFSSYPEGQLCYTVTGSYDGTDIPDVVSVRCFGTWRHLLVYTNVSNDKHRPALDFGEVKVLECFAGTYGPLCRKYCHDRKCRAGLLSRPCHHLTGQCVDGCKPGWNGTDCSQVCLPGTYGHGCKHCGERKCLSTFPCDHVTGECVNGCLRGWIGTNCTQVCPTGTYGVNCTKSCSARHCNKLSSSCDHRDGKCRAGCRHGWRGNDCTTQCSPGYYGANCRKSCSDRQCRTPSSSCDRVTGLCPDGCLNGLRGLDCTTRCPNDTFHVSCLPCDTRHCDGESDCPEDGTCSGGCQDGWTLNNCSQTCDRGHYGQQCAGVCNNRHCLSASSCNITTGLCDGGCQSGWIGSDCTLPHIRPSYLGPIAAIAGIVIGGLIVITLIVVVIVVICRRKRQKKTKGDTDHVYFNDAASKVKVNGEMLAMAAAPSRM